MMVYVVPVTSVIVVTFQENPSVVPEEEEKDVDN
jgi:hypothetical protein